MLVESTAQPREPLTQAADRGTTTVTVSEIAFRAENVLDGRMGFGIFPVRVKLTVRPHFAGGAPAVPSKISCLLVLVERYLRAPEHAVSPAYTCAKHIEHVGHA